MDDQSFRQQLQDLQARFIENVPQRIESIAEHLNAHRAGDPTALLLLHNALHSLLGTASTYGFKDVANEVAAFSKILRRLEAAGWPKNGLPGDELNAGLRALSETAKMNINVRPII